MTIKKDNKPTLLVSLSEDQIVAFSMRNSAQRSHSIP